MGIHGTSDEVALAALIISLIALFTTVAQVAQQYVTTASEGYRRCQRSVMGRWADFTKRKFKLGELRFEVLFETPVLFLARPDNKRGPISKRELYRVDGGEQSYKDTLTVEEQEEKTIFVHTTDDEKAGWVTLLESLQKMEKESIGWEGNIHIKPPSVAGSDRSIYVFVQRKTRSWDFMPLGATKPFATTTLSHLVEMAGLLGMYWKSFDVTRGDISAEGNGHTITSSQIRGLGLMINFSITGPSKFEDKRVIPNYGTKDYVFGFVPSILKGSDAGGRLLEVANLDKVKRLLATFAMDSTGIQLYEEKRNRRNLSPVTFELIAMLAKPMRLRGSQFRMLPNPTQDTWGGDSGSKISWVAAMGYFQTELGKIIEEMRRSETGPPQLFMDISNLYQRCSWQTCQDLEISLDMKEALHISLETTDKYLQEVNSDKIISVATSHLHNILADSAAIEASLTVLTVNAAYILMNKYFDDIRPRVIRSQILNLQPPSVYDRDEPITLEMRKREEIWVALIFRMICWFLLHNFDKADRCIVPSELKGSRMPVFIG